MDEMESRLFSVVDNNCVFDGVGVYGTTIHIITRKKIKQEVDDLRGD